MRKLRIKVAQVHTACGHTISQFYSAVFGPCALLATRLLWGLADCKLYYKCNRPFSVSSLERNISSTLPCLEILVSSCQDKIGVTSWTLGRGLETESMQDVLTGSILESCRSGQEDKKAGVDRSWSQAVMQPQETRSSGARVLYHGCPTLGLWPGLYTLFAQSWHVGALGRVCVTLGGVALSSWGLLPAGPAQQLPQVLPWGGLGCTAPCASH